RDGIACKGRMSTHPDMALTRKVDREQSGKEVRRDKSLGGPSRLCFCQLQRKGLQCSLQPSLEARDRRRSRNLEQRGCCEVGKERAAWALLENPGRGHRKRAWGSRRHSR